MLVLSKNKKQNSFFYALIVMILVMCLSNPMYVKAISIPEPTESFYVNDTAELISEENENYVIATNEDLYKKTGAQVVVVTIESLEGTSVEEYSTELFRKYGIGDADKNNGILILLSLNDRECRIEVGYGLEGTINDAKAGRIMDRFMIPYFKDSKWDEGIINGFDAVIDEICTEYDVEVSHNVASVPDTNEQKESDEDFWVSVVAIALGLIGGLSIGYCFPNKALIPGIAFLIADFAIFIAVFTFGYAILGFILSLIVYVIGWAITSPDTGGSSSRSYSGSYSKSYRSSSHSSYSSSSRNSGGGGSSGGGGASRKF